MAVDLKAELSVKLDASHLRDSLLGGIAGPTTTLQGVSSPVSQAQLTRTGQLAVQVNTSGIAAAAERVVSQLTGSLGSLPGPQEVLRPISSTLELVRTVTADDLANQINTLIGKLSAELSGSRDEGFLGVLERVGGVLGNAPELRAVLELLTTTFRAVGVNVQPPQMLGDALPAFAGSVRALGALMRLESALAEGERLTRIMAQQLDPAQVGPEIAALRTSFEEASASLSALGDSGVPPGAAEVETAAASVLGCNARLAAIDTLLSQSMGFGEATLVHFDIGRLEAEVREATAVLQGIDTDRIARALQSLLDRITPVIQLDLLAAPAQSLEALLRLLEARVSEIATAISGMNVGTLADPVRQGVERVTGMVAELSTFITEITGTVRLALEQVRQVVARLPIDEIARGIRSVLTPVTEAMEAVRALVAGVETALRTVSETVTNALGDAEHAIDTFKTEVDDLLGAAAQFMESLHLDQVVGAVADKVHAFADELAKAQMKPYFDTAVDAIGTAADVIGAVPLGLLPDSMKADLDAAVAPIRAIDMEQVKNEIEGLLAIREGKFELRGPLEDALREIQQRYDALVQEVRRADPRQLIAPINAEFARIRQTVERLAPQLTLQPLQDAVQRVKQGLASFDLAAQLRPLDEAFARVLSLVDAYSPVALIQPLEEQLTQARERLVSMVRLREWEASLDALHEQGKHLLDQFDPARLADLLEGALGEAKRLLTLAEQMHLAGSFGDFLAALLAGSGQRVHSWTFETVARWLGGGSGGQALAEHAEQIEKAIEEARRAVQAVDLRTLSTDLGQKLTAMRASIARLSAGSEARLRLQAVVDRVQVERPLAALATNQARYLAVLDAATTQAATLRRTGLSQVDVTITALQTAFSPVRVLQGFFRKVLTQIGVTDFDGGIVGVIRRVLDVASPERLGRILTPIVAAVRGRITALLDAVVAPLKQGITRLIALVDAIDLAPLRQAVAAIVAEVRQQILALSPRTLLGPTLDAFVALKTELATFDPLRAIREAVDQLKASVTRVLGKLKAEDLLAQPIRIYDEIVKALSALQLGNLLSPILDTLDTLAAQVDEGLDRTADALTRLQQALPAPGGGGAAALAASVSIG